MQERSDGIGSMALRFTLSGIFLLTSCFASAADAPAPVELRYTLGSGSAFSYQTSLKVNGQIKIPNEPKPDTLAAQMDMRQRTRVAEVDAKNGYFVLENRLFNLKLNNNGTVTNADSAPPIVTVMSPAGKVQETRGLDTLATANVLPGLDPTTFSSLIYNPLSFPEKPVKPGDTWLDEVQVQLPNGRKAAAVRKLTLHSLGTEKGGERSARIRTELTLPINIEVQGANGGKIQGSQTGTGESRILLADGMPLESRTDMRMEIAVMPNQLPTTGKDQKPAKGGTVQVTTTIRMEAKRVPDEPPPTPKTQAGTATPTPSSGTKTGP